MKDALKAIAAVIVLLAVAYLLVIGASYVGGFVSKRAEAAFSDGWRSAS